MARYPGEVGTIMNLLITYARKAQAFLDKVKSTDFLGSLFLRLYLTPIFWVAGMNKANAFDATVQWFGNPEWGLGLPMPTILAFMATLSEMGGAVLLFLGLATRWISIPLMFTMIIAITSVHWENGWQAVHDLKSPFASTNAEAAIENLREAKEVLREHANYDQLIEHGGFVVSNNGIEWATTYFIMLFALFFLGGGRYVSLDYWIARRFIY